MLQSITNYLDKFTPEILVISAGLLVITATLFLWVWFDNRRKYQHLKHQIPASVIKSYLDSIIQNSNSLKSSLFRGGGQDVSATASVLPLGQMGSEGLVFDASKNADLANLQSQLAEAKRVQRELEQKLGGNDSDLTGAQKKIKELEAQLSKGGAAGNNDDVQLILKEKNSLEEKLKEYEVIEDDLANLKRLQQENQQLKRTLESMGGTTSMKEAIQETLAAAPVAEEISFGQLPKGEELFNEATPIAQDETDKALEEFLTEGKTEEVSSVETAVAVEAAPVSEEAEVAKVEKTPEDLLSEFEKMLG